MLASLFRWSPFWLPNPEPQFSFGHFESVYGYWRTVDDRAPNLRCFNTECRLTIFSNLFDLKCETIQAGLPSQTATVPRVYEDHRLT